MCSVNPVDNHHFLLRLTMTTDKKPKLLCTRVLNAISRNAINWALLRDRRAPSNKNVHLTKEHLMNGIPKIHLSANTATQ